MPKYHAIYRVLVSAPEFGPQDFLDEYYDSYYDKPRPLRNSLDDYVISLAKELPDLNDTQLESLLTIVSKKYAIRVSEDWSVDKNERGVVYLMSDAVFQHLAKNLDDADKLDLKRMRDRYNRAKRGVNHFDSSILKPLLHCINWANTYKNSQSPTTPANKQAPKASTTDYDTAKKKAALEYALEVQRKSPAIRTNVALAEHIRDKYPEVRSHHFSRWGKDAEIGRAFQEEVDKIRETHMRGHALPTSEEIQSEAQAEAEINDVLDRFLRKKGWTPMTVQEFVKKHPPGSAINDEFFAFYEDARDNKLGIGKRRRLREDMD